MVRIALVIRKGSSVDRASFRYSAIALGLSRYLPALNTRAPGIRVFSLAITCPWHSDRARMASERDDPSFCRSSTVWRGSLKSRADLISPRPAGRCAHVRNDFMVTALISLTCLTRRLILRLAHADPKTATRNTSAPIFSPMSPISSCETKWRPEEGRIFGSSDPGGNPLCDARWSGSCPGRGQRRTTCAKTRFLSHYLSLPQRRDLVRAKTELGEHLVGLLAELRRGCGHLARGA
jgi:hypothetical protein